MKISSLIKINFRINVSSEMQENLINEKINVSKIRFMPLIIKKKIFKKSITLKNSSRKNMTIIILIKILIITNHVSMITLKIISILS